MRPSFAPWIFLQVKSTDYKCIHSVHVRTPDVVMFSAHSSPLQLCSPPEAGILVSRAGDSGCRAAAAHKLTAHPQGVYSLKHSSCYIGGDTSTAATARSFVPSDTSSNLLILLWSINQQIISALFYWPGTPGTAVQQSVVYKFPGELFFCLL